MSKHLIVGIDGSPESEAAMGWALEEATRRDLEVELVYALAVPVVSDAYGMVMTRPDIDELTDYSQKLLDAALASAQSVAPHLAVSARLASGPPAAVLIEASKHAEGLVVGTRGLGAISGKLLGSVSVRLAGKSVSPGVHRAARVARAHAAGLRRCWSAWTARSTPTPRCTWLWKRLVAEEWV